MSQQSNLKEIIKEEYKKCFLDPIYFIKKYCLIQHPTRGKIPFNLYSFQEKLINNFTEHSRNIILKNRQMGISTLSAAYALWLMLFHKDKFVIVIATKQDVAKNIITKVKVMHGNLPSWLKIKCTEDNKLGQTYINGSWIKAITTSSEDSGRSEGVSLLIIDEAAFIKGMDEMWGALQPTLSTGGDIIVLSTPNGYGNWFHKTFQYASEGKNGFNPITLHWTMHPERDQAWRDEQDIELGPRLAAQECDGSFITSGASVVDGELLQWYKETFMQEPLEKTGYDRNVWLWEYPSFSKSYLIAADVARGDGNDWSTFQIIDIETMTQVAEYQGKIPTKEFGNLLVEYGIKYNDALIVIENSTIGWAVIQAVMDRNYSNLYYTEEDHKYVDQSKVNKTNRKKKVAGFTTSHTTRPLMIAKMEEYYRNKNLIVRSERLLNEQFVFVWNGNKPEAAPGYNDDLVMAQAIGLWVRDTAIKLRMQGVDMTRSMINNITIDRTTPIMSSKDKRNNPYTMLVGNKEKEDLSKWL